MLTKEQFVAKYRGRFLLHLTEAWAARRARPSDLGEIVDAHALDIKALMSEIYDELTKTIKLETEPLKNGPQGVKK